MATKPQTDPTITPTLLPPFDSSSLGVGEADGDGKVDELAALVEEAMSDVVDTVDDEGMGEEDVSGSLVDEAIEDDVGFIEEDVGATDELVIVCGGGAELEAEGPGAVEDADTAFVDVAPGGASLEDVHVLNKLHRN